MTVYTTVRGHIHVYTKQLIVRGHIQRHRPTHTMMWFCVVPLSSSLPHQWVGADCLSLKISPTFLAVFSLVVLRHLLMISSMPEEGVQRLEFYL